MIRASDKPETVSADTTVSEIARLHREILAAARTSLDKAICIGELLTEIKSGLPHGQWLPWVKANVPFAERTARNYMRCHRERDRLKSASVADLTDTYKLLRDRPDDLLDELPDAATLADDISEAGQARFEEFHQRSMSFIESGLESLCQTQNLAEVVRHVHDSKRILQFWQEVTLHCERNMGAVLIEMQTIFKQAPELAREYPEWASLAACGKPEDK